MKSIRPQVTVLWVMLTLVAHTALGQVADSVCFNTAPAAFISNSAASGGDNLYTYQWQDSTSGGAWSAAPGTNNGLVYQPGSLTTTTYFRRQVSSASCGISFSNTLTVHVFAALDSTSTNLSSISCNGGSDGSITVNMTGGLAPYSYTWSSGGSTTATNSGLSAGTYTVSVTDMENCDNLVYTFTLAEPALLTSSSIIDSTVSCNGLSDGGATASATGGTSPYTYSWSNSATTASITGIAAGTYSVTVTDANGCTDSSSVTLVGPISVVATASLDSNVTCNGFFDGGAAASATGGTMPYTYNWSNSASTAGITGVAAGTYSVTITDANGCSDSASVVIIEPVVLLAQAVVDSNVSCNGLSDGGASASASGGTMPYSYAWSNGASTAAITGVVAGTYSVTITDANGCTDSTSVVLTEPNALMANITTDSTISCFGFSDGGLTASGSGGTGAYTFVWSNSATTASITGLSVGTYSVTISDANGCTDSASLTLSEPTALSLTATPTNVTCNGGLDGAVSLVVTGGSGGYGYLWSTGSMTSGITGVGAATYTVTVTDANNCTGNTSATVSQPAVLNGGTVNTGN